MAPRALKAGSGRRVATRCGPRSSSIVFLQGADAGGPAADTARLRVGCCPKTGRARPARSQLPAAIRPPGGACLARRPGGTGQRPLWRMDLACRLRVLRRLVRRRRSGPPAQRAVNGRAGIGQASEGVTAKHQPTADSSSSPPTACAMCGIPCLFRCSGWRSSSRGRPRSHGTWPGRR